MKTSLNLMSQRARNREATRRRLRQWAGVLGLAGLVLAPLGGWRWWRSHQLARQRSAAVARYEPVRQMKSENAHLAQQIEKLRTGQRVTLALAEQRPVLALLGVAAAAIAEQNGAVFLQQFEVEQDPLAAASDNPPPAAFVMEGAAVDGRAVAQLADAIKGSGPFTKVDVKTSEGRSDKGQGLTAFTIRCAY